MPITGRDDEFRATISYYFRQELGREPNASEMAAYLTACQNGMTGAQIQTILHNEPEAVAYRARPPVPRTPRLHVEGLKFVTEDGKPWRMAFADSFRAYERFLHGEDLRPHLQELADLGANGVRVFGAFDFGSPETQRLYPREHPDYFIRLPPFFALLRDFGFYAQWCAFADTQRSVPGASDQAKHWWRLCDVLTLIPNVLLQRVNEEHQHENRLDAVLSKPPLICSSYGSEGAGQDPPAPFWNYADLGSERHDDFSLSSTTVHFSIFGYPGFVGTQRATVVSEPPGFGEAKTGSRTNDPVVAYQLGVGAGTWGAGGCAHSDCGVQSVMLTPIQRVCVAEFLRGVKA